MSRFEELSAGRGGAERTRAVAAAVQVLREGGLVVHPTSTIYGIGGAATPAVDAEVGRLKGRSSTVPLVRLAAAPTTVQNQIPGLRWDARATRLADRFWPGPLTLVLDDGTQSGIAVRVDSHPVLGAILESWGKLMSSSSVNLSGQRPARSPGAIRRVLDRLPEPRSRLLFIEAGDLPASPPSTLLSLREQPARILRVGSVSPDAIRECIEEAITSA